MRIEIIPEIDCPQDDEAPIRFTSRADIHQWASDALERWDEDCYDMTIDEMEERLTDAIASHEDFRYGQDARAVIESLWDESLPDWKCLSEKNAE